MTTTSVSNTAKENPLLAQLGQQSVDFATQLNKLRYIYALYGLLDGLSISYSMFKQAFDLWLKNSSSSADVMHEWLLTPEGIAIAISITTTTMLFSLFANYWTDDNKNDFKSFVAQAWPYLRDTSKGLKNAYKGFRSTIQVADLLGYGNLNHLIIPVGLALGILSAINRIWYRYHKEIRKKMMDTHKGLLKSLRENKGELTWEAIAAYRSQIQSQSLGIRRAMMLSAAYGGIVDGLYLYIGVLTLCSLSPPMLTALTVFCAIYFATCIISRVYEEYNYQCTLTISQAKIELVLRGKELELQFLELSKLAEEIATLNSTDPLKLKRQLELAGNLDFLRSRFEEQWQYLRGISTLSYTSAFLAGMKNGLAAYGALASAMFAVATILTLASTAFPPVLLIVSVSLGLALLIGFIVESLINAHRYKQKITEDEINKPHDAELNKLLQDIKSKKARAEELSIETVRTSIPDDIKGTPQFAFTDFWEIVRSVWSGAGKGSKAVSFMMNGLQERDEHTGHYHDAPIMLGFTIASVLIHSVILGGRAWARGFGRDRPGEEGQAAGLSTAPDTVAAAVGGRPSGPGDSTQSGKPTTSFSGESDATIRHSSDSQDSAQSALHHLTPDSPNSFQSSTSSSMHNSDIHGESIELNQSSESSNEPSIRTSARIFSSGITSLFFGKTAPKKTRSQDDLKSAAKLVPPQIRSQSAENLQTLNQAPSFF
ncbi:hypothetical protein [Legionella jordanis]|uniref:Transmembrane protein n=1 Tax=Legionella jordanis TaxID=456 RepID=A0A0W0VDN9_9GAMM|nr:hypothetical protein [Legionella jordanis]KTD17997.1 transmembrane protein [Legionella jordanis]RMX02313.1 hypothetical protein EAW55_08625 [Legionella jordanis]RMX21202.1 hypothetical protein EAS68_03245 [Legionella jordanis]VEH13911.1 transmembrane protein [Legionella jordanis]HAT8714291.1 hypothetical protein [Legionella jordanis]